MDKTQKTPKGHEIPVPERDEFVRDLNNIVKTKRSTRCRPRKQGFSP